MTKLTKGDYNRIVARISAVHLQPGQVHNGRHWLIYRQDDDSYYIFDKTKQDYIIMKRKKNVKNRKYRYDLLYTNWKWHR